MISPRTRPPRLALGALAATLAATLCACPCEQDQSVDRRGRKIGADVEEPGRLSHVPEIEPNDAADTATAYTLIPSAPGSTLHKPFEGELSDKRDVDYIRLPAQPDLSIRGVQIKPLSDDFDPVILWGADSWRQNLAGPGEVEEIVNLTNAEVTLGVTRPKGAKGGLYQLILVRSALSGGVEIEPPPAEGLQVKLPGEIQGLINHNGDTDRYLLDLQSLPPQDGGAGAARALRLELVPPPDVAMRITPMIGGVELTTFEVEARPAAELTPLVWPNLGVAPDAESLEVLVSAPGAGEGVRQAYTLRALIHPPTPEGFILETEPSDIVRPIYVEGKAQVVGYIHHDADTDVYLIDVKGERASAPMLLNVRLEGQGLDWSIDLNTPKDRGEVQEVINGEKPGGAEIICSRVILSGETRLVVRIEQPKVAKAGKGRAGDNPTGHYKLFVEARLASGEEVEPNGAQGEANDIGLDATLSGHVHPAGDADLYRFEIKAAPAPQGNEGSPGLGAPDPDAPESPAPLQAIQIVLSGAGLNLALEILAEEGLPVAQADAAAAGEEERVALDLPAGVYFARVKAGPRDASCEAAYTLKLQRR